MNLFTTAALLAMALGDPGYVALPVKRHEAKLNETSSPVAKRSNDAIPETLENKVVQYLVEFELGTPGQKQIASIDTGSSDLWVYGPNTGAPTTYDHSQSSTSKYVNNGFQIAYVDGTTSSGDYYTDEIKWGSTEIDFQFAVTAQKYTRMNGVFFGIATEATEASEDGKYPNFPVALKQQGKIDSVAYSLYLDDINSSSGTLLFGAVDTSQYTGPIKALPITSTDRLSVDVEVAGQKINGILDSGTSLTYLPDDIVSEIASQVGAELDFFSGMYVASGTPSGSVTYSFDGVDVTVPTSELFIELAGAGNGQYLTILSNSQTDGLNLLGDSFLRSAYVVYDLSNKQIAIAQANNHPGESHFVPITSEGIPGTY